MAGTLVIDTLADGSGNSASATAAIRGSAKAWVNFNGSNGSVRASYNVSSVSRSSTGVYTINFTTAMTDVNYSVAGNTSATLAGMNTFTTITFNTTSLVINAVGQSGGTPTYTDPTYVSVNVFR